MLWIIQLHIPYPLHTTAGPLQLFYFVSDTEMYLFEEEEEEQRAVAAPPWTSVAVMPSRVNNMFWIKIWPRNKPYLIYKS